MKIRIHCITLDQRHVHIGEHAIMCLEKIRKSQHQMLACTINTFMYISMDLWYMGLSIIAE